MTDDPSIQTMLDENAIRAAVARFADSVTRADSDMLRATLSDRCRLTIGDNQHADTADDVVEAIRGLRKGRDFFVQFAIPGVIEIDGDIATTRTFVHESARGPGEQYYRNHCIAFDRLRQSGNEWLFEERSFQYLWLDTGPFAGHGFPLFPA